MGQFDQETDAALAQLNNEAISEVPGVEFVEIIGDLIKLIGTGGVWGLTGGISSLALKVRRLAGESYASNLIYAITAVRNDLATLYERYEALRSRIDSLPADPKFAEAISALALRAMHTSVKDRLKRLARIVVNGVKENDLESERLDDMMRAAVELREDDITVLKNLYEMQRDMFLPEMLNCEHNQKINTLLRRWQEWWMQNIEQYKGSKGMNFNSSCTRLQSLGFIVPLVGRSFAQSPTSSDYELLFEGMRFYERLREITVDN